MDGAHLNFDYLKENVGNVQKIKFFCGKIAQNPEEIENYAELKELVLTGSPTIAQICTPSLLSAFFPFIKIVSQDRKRFKTIDKQLIIEHFGVILSRLSLDKLVIFFNIYGFILFELYDPKNKKTIDTDEEYKLALVKCMTSLIKSVEHSQIEHLYVKENAPKLSQIIYVLLELARCEKLKQLQIASVECLMEMARVSNDEDFKDSVSRKQIAQVFLFFLPGISTELKNVILCDEKYGHAVPCIALKAWGRIVTLLMQDYNPVDSKIVTPYPKKAWKDENELKNYLQSTDRTRDWYKANDEKLQHLIGHFFQLTSHPHHKIRAELLNLSKLLVEFCMNTMPKSISKLCLIIIALTEDEHVEIARDSVDLLSKVSSHFVQYRGLLEDLEEEFYNTISSLPRIFNGIDEKQQIVAMNLLTGFVTLFGSNFSKVLHSSQHLNKLMMSLVHICEFDTSGISILEEHNIEELEDFSGALSHRQFRCFNDEIIVKKIEKLCHVLGQYDESLIIYDYLINLIATDLEHRKEAIFLLNSLLVGIPSDYEVFKNIINMYTEDTYWNLPMSVMIDEFGFEHTLGDVKSNILQICLLTEGIGKCATLLGTDFHKFLLKILYITLERAGSHQSLVRNSGRETLSQISRSLQYDNISELITQNVDYFSFQLERNLKKQHRKEALEVLSVVLKYNRSDDKIIELFEQMLHAFQRNEHCVNSYLKVFKMFVSSLENKFTPLETITRQFHDVEHFQVSNIEPFDNLMKQNAEEMYKEDLQKNAEELEDEISPNEGYQKPKPTPLIKLIVEMLRKSLHFIPSKDRNCKLSTLDLLTITLPFLHNWQDELLPIVHEIFEILTVRFSENDPLVVMFALKLLTTMVQLSHDFLRSRVAKQVLPKLFDILEKSEKDSELKDRGSAYRQSQNFKLQVELLKNLGTILTFTDAKNEDIQKSMEVTGLYLSTKQPRPLQDEALNFFKVLLHYDAKLVTEFLTPKKDKSKGTEYEKNYAELFRIVMNN